MKLLVAITTLLVSLLARVLVDTRGKSYEEWVEERFRHKLIGGSDSAAALGLSQYRSELELGAVLLDRMDPPELGPVAKKKTEWGRRLEEPVRQAYREAGNSVWEFPAIICHDDYPWIGGDVDGFTVPVDTPNYREPDPDALRFPDVERHGVYEGKTSTGWQALAWEDGPPLTVKIQVVHYMLVTGLRWGVVTALLNGWDFRTWRIERNDEDIDNLLAAYQDFWHYIDRGELPPPGGSKATTEFLARQWDVTTDKIADLPPQARALLANRRAAKARAKEAETEAARCDNTIRQIMEDREVAHLEGHQVATWRRPRRFNARKFLDEQGELARGFLTVDAAAVKEADPKLHAQYLEPDPTAKRRFVVARNIDTILEEIPS